MKAKQLSSFGKQLLRNFAAMIYYASGKRKTIHKGSVVILMYHRVLPKSFLEKNLVLPGMYVERKTFEVQMAFLRRIYDIISIDEFIRRFESKEWDLNKQYCIITFDDGWWDNFEYAFPILKKYGLPATVSLPTCYIGSHKMFWYENLAYFLRQCENSGTTVIAKKRLNKATEELGLNVISLSRILKARRKSDKLILFDLLVEEMKKFLPEHIEKFLSTLEDILEMHPQNERQFLNWEEVKEMSTVGISFGSHGCTHRILTYIPLTESRSEIFNSMETLAKEGIRFAPVFCYPNGNSNPNITRLVMEAGYKMSLSTRNGVVPLHKKKLFELNRIGIHNDMTSSKSLLSLRLSGLLIQPWRRFFPRSIECPKLDI